MTRADEWRCAAVGSRRIVENGILLSYKITFCFIPNYNIVIIHSWSRAFAGKRKLTSPYIRLCTPLAWGAAIKNCFVRYIVYSLRVPHDGLPRELGRRLDLYRAVDGIIIIKIILLSGSRCANRSAAVRACHRKRAWALNKKKAHPRTRIRIISRMTDTMTTPSACRRDSASHKIYAPVGARAL